MSIENKPLSEIFLENLEFLMLLRKISQASLALSSGLSRVQINRLINEGRTPNLSTIEALAKGLNVPAFLLMYDIEFEDNDDIDAIKNAMEAIATAKLISTEKLNNKK